MVNRLEEIKHISTIVNDWLKHLETKNVAFLSVLTGLFTLVVTLKYDSLMIEPYWLILSVSFVISGCILLYSFIPRVKPGKSHVKNNEINSVIFFADIGKTNLETYTKGLIETLSPENPQTELSAYEKMIVSDIWNNSRISLTKSRCFKIALIPVIIGVIIATLFFFFY